MAAQQTLLTGDDDMATADLAASGQLAEVKTTAIATTPMEILERAVMSGRSPDELKGLMDLVERYEARDAERAYAAAKKACKAELPIVVRDKRNTETGKNYASLENVSQRIDPIITKWGFALSFSSKPYEQANHVLLTCRCRHERGHYEDYELPLPYDMTGPKGGANKTAIQGMVSSISYGKRCLKLMAFDVTVADTDVDGRDLDKRITEEQVQLILKGLKDTDSSVDAFCEAFQIASVDELGQTAYQQAMGMIARKRRKPQ